MTAHSLKGMQRYIDDNWAEMALFCISNGYDMTETDELNQTVLHYAAFNGSENIMLILIHQSTPAVWVSDFLGRLPIDIAYEFGTHDIFEILFRVTYPRIFVDDVDGKVDVSIVVKYDELFSQLGQPDTRAGYMLSDSV